jgi:uncharacterized protein (DUF1697 family)
VGRGEGERAAVTRLRSLALLRGVNVGGARSLKSDDLKRVFLDAGADEAETVIQSGNVVFRAAHAESVAIQAESAILARFGFRPTIVLRDAKAWASMVEANPFVKADADPATLHVACLARSPAPSPRLPLDPQAFAPDEFIVSGADLYLRLPNGVAKAALTNAVLDKAFGTISTLRNWRTALRLLERLQA